MKKEFKWQTAINYTILDTNAIFKNFGISNKDIKKHANEIAQQIIAIFNYMSFSNA
jgi:hypothetical protein